MSRYALITPARNEEAFIEKTIGSVIDQTVLPVKWIIVNDRSTDRTGEIANRYAAEHRFIEVVHIDGDSERNFGSKSKAIAYAYERLAATEFEYLGNLDADVSFADDYYQDVLGEMERNPRLGLAGGIRYDRSNDGFVLVRSARNSVGGPFQLFRRECFEAIGGYQVLPYGGIDAVAEISVRMHGWEVQSFPEYRVYHHRATGTEGRSIWSARYRSGIRDYTIGYHPMFELVRTASRINQRPYLVGSLVWMAGYTAAMLRRIERPVSSEYIAYLHREQMGRLRKALRLKG